MTAFRWSLSVNWEAVVKQTRSWIVDMVLRHCEVAPHWLPGVSTSKISKGEIFLSFQFLWNQRSTTKQKNTIQVKSLILVPAIIVRLGITSTGRQHSLNWVSWLWCPSGVSCSNNNNQSFRASYTPQWIRLKFITWSRRSSLRCNQSRSRYMVNSVEHSGIPSL